MEKSDGLGIFQGVVNFFMKTGDISIGENYRIQLVPSFSTLNLSCRNIYLYDPEIEWKSEGSTCIWKVPGKEGAGYFLELWRKVGPKKK